MTTERTPQIYLFGNLGADPETKILHPRTVTREVYDAIVDDAVVRDFTSPAREIHTASIAVNAEDAEGHRVTRWHRLVDFAGHLSAYRKGDRLKVRGYFRARTYFQGGQQKSIREFLVAEVSLLKMRCRPA